MKVEGVTTRRGRTIPNDALAGITTQGYLWIRNNLDLCKENQRKFLFLNGDGAVASFTSDEATVARCTVQYLFKGDRIDITF